MPEIKPKNTTNRVLHYCTTIKALTMKDMPNNLVILFLILLFSGVHMNAQDSPVIITGEVVDKATGQPVPYATVAVMNTSSEEMITGTTTANDGTFKIKTSSGRDFYLEISFIGYQNAMIRDYDIRNNRLNLGMIELLQDARQLQQVDVTAERSTVEFRLDKRVFNVGQDISSTGMGALEVLDNVPSVNVDIEGNISLRGNQGVQILINGKPSVLSDEGSNALGTITADMIESVEVITNPSAKYEAEGTSGIINIVLRKEEKKGFNGSASVNTGVPHNHSIGASLNLRTDNFNFFTQFGGGYRSLPRYRESEIRDLTSRTFLKSDGIEYRNEEFYNITLGTDYYINDFNIITLSGSFAYEIEDQPSETEFEFYNFQNELVSSFEREETTSAGNPKYQYDLQYKRQFGQNEDHVLLLSTLGSFFGKELSSEFQNTPIVSNEVDPDQITETDFHKQDFVYKIDYTNPLDEQWTIEAGAHYEINDVGNDYAVFDVIGGDEVVNENFTNNFEYNQKVLGLYGTGSYEGETWGVKLGLRVENTDLTTLLTNTGERNYQRFTNLFPTFHTSYKFSERLSFQAGYSRRVTRPRLWDLNPFFNIRNQYNIRQGNPRLLPEFGDSYELTGILILDQASINASVYHLYTRDVIDRVFIYEDNVTIQMPENIGTRNQTGFEINGKYTPVKWLTINGDFNYGIFSRDGMFQDQNFDFEGELWHARVTTKVKLPFKIEVELTGNYRSPYETVQGSRSGFAHADAGIRKKLWDGKGVINFSVRDVFASRIRENIIDQENYYVYDFSQRGRFITLGFSYSFGKGEAMTYTGRRR